jgi:hypothetical protein
MRHIRPTFGATSKRGRLLLAAAAGVSAAVVASGPALASTNDDFTVSTGDGCGSAQFVDYGPGAPGNSANNDDYIVIHDYCGDHHGVKAWLWWYDSNGNNLATGLYGYNGNGEAGAPVYWDPFKGWDGNVLGGDKVVIKVCLVDGAGASSGTSCASKSHISADG